MRLLASWLLSIAVCSASQSNALDPGIEPRAILSALNSDDPRAVAWAAWRALNVPYISVSTQFNNALQKLDPGNPAHRPAIHSVLHSIIELKLAVPSDTLYRYFEHFPAPSLIALSRTKIDAAILSLLTSTNRNDVHWTVLAEIAYHAEIPGLARILLNGYSAAGFLSVADDYDGQVWHGAGLPMIGSILETSHGDADAWPPLFVYSLDLAGESGDTLLIAAPIPIYARRHREEVHRSGGMHVDLRTVRHKLLMNLTASFSERLLIHQDGFRYQDITSCPPDISMSVVWRGNTDLVQRFSKLHRDRQKWCDRMIDVLRKRGALSPSDTLTIPIRWTVRDARSIRTEQLPDLSKIADVDYLGGQKP